MMPRRALLLAVGLVAPILLGAAPATTTTSVAEEHQGARATVAQLLDDPEAFAGVEVVVRGELVGDFGRRSGDWVWTQLNDDPYAYVPLLGGGSLAGGNAGIGVRIPDAMWPGFDEPGGYRVRGPLVELTGWWRYHDPERGGETYLDVSAISVIDGPRELQEGVRWVPLGVGAGLLGAALALGLALRRRRPAGTDP
jgi:hypothetical protein